MTIENERRGFARVQVSIGATVISGDEQIQCESAKDLSMSGAYFVADRTLPVGTRCDVQFEFRADERPVLIEACGDVVRIGPDGFAVQFEKACSMRNFDKIRNLVIYRALEQVSLPLEGD